MTLLLPSTTVQVRRATPIEYDTHGWAVEGTRVVVATLPASVQERLPFSNPLAQEGGGEGPFNPDVTRTADVYLNPDAALLVGDLLDTGGDTWLVNAVRRVVGPLPPLAEAVVADCTLWATGES